MSMQLDGLATGMDTTSMVEQLVQLEAKPIMKYQEEIKEMEGIQDAWREVNGQLDKLEDTTTDLKLRGTFNSRSADSSNEDAVTASASNGASEGNYNIKVQETAKNQRFVGNEKVKDSSTALNDLDGFNLKSENSISFNGTEISITDDDSLRDIAYKINDSDSGVEASIVDSRLVLETTETGDESNLDADKIGDPDGILESLGVVKADGNIAKELQAATDAKISINGIEEITSSTNTFDNVVDDVTFKVNPDADVDSDTDKTVSSNISVSHNTGKAKDAVSTFVEQYNGVMSFIDGQTEYDEEEEKGEILQGDSTASRLQMRLRELVTSQVKDEGDYRTMSSVGIEVDRDGVMSFDESKFEDSLRDKPEDVMQLFRADSEEDGFDGMAVRMDSYLDQLMQSNTGVIPRRLGFYDNRIDSLNEDIEDVERKVEMTRERYTQEFSDMEEAISEMNQQQKWMQSQLGSMGGSANMISSMM